MGANINHLERFYDGHVPDHLRKWAIEQDNLEAKAAKHEYIPPTPSPAIPRPAALIVPPMARLLVDRSAAHDCCTEADLTGAGFTKAEIALHGEAARRLASQVMAPIAQRAAA